MEGGREGLEGRREGGREGGREGLEKRKGEGGGGRVWREGRGREGLEGRKGEVGPLGELDLKILKSIVDTFQTQYKNLYSLAKGANGGKEGGGGCREEGGEREGVGKSLYIFTCADRTEAVAVEVCEYGTTGQG